MALITWTSPYVASANLQSSDQTNATAVIAAVCKAMETYTHRHFEQAEYDKVFDIKAEGTVYLDAFPIDHLTRVLFTRQDVLSITSTAQVATAAVSDTALNLFRVDNGLRTETSLLFTSYPSLSSLATAINGLGGWTATVSSGYGGYPSVDLVSGTNVSCPTGTTATLPMWSDSNGIQYLCNNDRGYFHVYLNNLWLSTGSYTGTGGDYDNSGWPFGGFGIGSTNTWFNDTYRRARVIWTGGYASGSIPEDLQRVAGELFLHFWNEQHGLITSENLGVYSYDLANEFAYARIPVSTRKILDSYMDRTV